MVNANVSVASGAKRKAGADGQDTRGSGISKNQPGQGVGKGRLVGRMSFGRLFLGGLLAIPSDIRRSWISTLSTTLNVVAHVHHIGRHYALARRFSIVDSLSRSSRLLLEAESCL